MPATVAIPPGDLQTIFENLRRDGLSLVGPTLSGGAIVLDEIESVDQLPFGWTDDQQPGRVRAKNTWGKAYFEFNATPQSWRRWLQSPRVRLFASDAAMRIEPAAEPVPRYALIGVRACDLAAIGVLDRVLTGGEHRDPQYTARRSAAFIFAVNCGKASSTCFCASMNCGPRVEAGFDLAATELSDSLVVEIGSEAGAAALEGTSWSAATAFDLARAAQVVRRTEAQMTREVRTDHIGSLLFEHLESPRWNEIAARCLGCGNCTMVCPTCFCTTVCDSVELTGCTVRTREWDSCFTSEFSHVHGGSSRPSLRARYRQWMTHKFASLKEQFGVTGCVGCGRCIAWCPVGIDVTEELQSFRSAGA